jgi:integrase
MRYRPVNVLPAQWDQVKEFCRQAVLDYGPPNGRIAAEMLSTVTLFTLWATHDEGAPLDAEELFHPTLMGRYLRTRVNNTNPSAYRTLRSRLFRVAKAATGIKYNRHRSDRFSVEVHEYTDAEIAELESWAASRRTAIARRYMRTVLALVGGAGLRTAEVLHAKGRDILRDSDGYSVRVGGTHPRVVPIHADWAGYLDVDQYDDDAYLVFPNGTDLGRATTLKMMYRGPHPAPNPQGLRDSWLLGQFRALPVPVVMQAGGIGSVTVLRRYLPHLQADDYGLWSAAVRNPRQTRLAPLSPTYGSAGWELEYAQHHTAAASENASLSRGGARSPLEDGAR